VRGLLNAFRPLDMLKQNEISGDFQSIGVAEELKHARRAVWDYYCMKQNVPVGMSFMDSIKDYEKKELSKRNNMTL